MLHASRSAQDALKISTWLLKRSNIPIVVEVIVQKTKEKADDFFARATASRYIKKGLATSSL